MPHSLLFIIIVLFSSNTLGAEMPHGDMKMKKEDALGVAIKEVRRLSYPVDSMRIEIEPIALEWKDFTAKYKDYIDDKVLNDIPKNHFFWAIYFSLSPKTGEVITGGDVWVFVDTSSGRIISVIRGK